MSMMRMIRFMKAIGSPTRRAAVADGKQSPHGTTTSGSYPLGSTVPIQYPISTSTRGKIAKVLAAHRAVDADAPTTAREDLDIFSERAGGKSHA